MAGKDFDLEATLGARAGVHSAQNGICGWCTKPIYKETPYPGVWTEWKHRSSGHVVSWQPDKHVAGPQKAYQHSHRAPNAAVGQMTIACEIAGCEADMTPAPKAEPVEALTGKEQALMVSRKRGSDRAKGKTLPPKTADEIKARSLGSGTGF